MDSNPAFTRPKEGENDIMDILVLPGDGIGEEITKATIAVLDVVNAGYALGLDFTFEDIGFAALEKTGTTLPDAVLEKGRNADGIILGPISHLDYPARDKGGVNISAAFRCKLDLYANIRPARSRPGISNIGGDMDLVIMRECTEGYLSDRNMVAGTGEFMPTPDIALSVRKITRQGFARIAESAFELARRRRGKVTIMHKGNVLHLSDGLFRDTALDVAGRYADVTVDEVLADAAVGDQQKRQCRRGESADGEPLVPAAARRVAGIRRPRGLGLNVAHRSSSPGWRVSRSARFNSAR